MFPLFKKRTKVTEIKVLDLTINSTLEDDYFLPHDIKQELLKRGIRANCTPLTAEKRIEEWEDEYSIYSIRREYNEGNWEEVVTLATGRINVHEGTEPHIHKIRSLYQLKRWQECIESCNGLLDVEENNVNALRFIARCARVLDDANLSIEYYKKLIETNQNDDDAIISLIRLNYNSKDYDMVIYYSELLIRFDSQSMNGYRFLARGYLAIGEHNKSVEVLLKLHDLEPNNIDTIVDIGRTYYTLRMYEKGLTWLEMARSIDNNEQRARRTLSLCYDRLRMWEKALQMYREECNFALNDYSNWEKLVNLYYRLNREADAKKCLQDIDDSLGDSLEKYVLMYKLSLSFHWYNNASDILHHIEETWGDSPEFYFSIIEMSFQFGNLTNILKYLRKGKKSCKKYTKYVEYKQRFASVLKSLNVSQREIHRKIKLDKTCLHSELAIDNILNISKNIQVNTPRNGKLKTIIISSTLGRGGAERQVVNCLKGLKTNPEYQNVQLFCNVIDNSDGRIATYAPEINEIGIPIYEYSNTEKWEEEFGDTTNDLGIFQDAFQLLPEKMQNAIRPLYFAFKQIRPDIVHAWQDQTNINVSIAAKMAGVPGIVLFARSLRPDNKTMMHIRTRPYLCEAYNSVLKDKKILLCHNSNAGAKSYAEWLETKVSRFPVIHNGVDFDDMEEVSDNIGVRKQMAELGISEDCKIIGGVFRFVQEKRPKLWIDSVIKVAEKNPNYHAVLVGGGGMSDYILALIKEAGMEDRIHLVGQTRYIKSWLENFDVFLLTSIVEGLPNVLIEAQAFSVPVITTDAGGANDTILNGESGFVVEADSDIISDKIYSCISNTEWMGKAAKAARKNSRNKFSTEKMLSNLIQIYDKSIR